MDKIYVSYQFVRDCFPTCPKDCRMNHVDYIQILLADKSGFVGQVEFSCNQIEGTFYLSQDDTTEQKVYAKFKKEFKLAKANIKDIEDEYGNVKDFSKEVAGALVKLNKTVN